MRFASGRSPGLACWRRQIKVEPSKSLGNFVIKVEGMSIKFNRHKSTDEIKVP